MKRFIVGVDHHFIDFLRKLDIGRSSVETPFPDPPLSFLLVLLIRDSAGNMLRSDPPARSITKRGRSTIPFVAVSQFQLPLGDRNLTEIPSRSTSLTNLT